GVDVGGGDVGGDGRGRVVLGVGQASIGLGQRRGVVDGGDGDGAGGGVRGQGAVGDGEADRAGRGRVVGRVQVLHAAQSGLVVGDGVGAAQGENPGRCVIGAGDGADRGELESVTFCRAE